MKKLIGMSLALFLSCVCISEIYSQTYAPIYATRIELKNGLNKTIINPNASGGTRSISFPTDVPADGEVLTWHTDGLLSWDAPAGGGGGSLTGTGALGRVAFWTTGSNLSNSDSLQWDNTNFRLGINTAPSVALDIDGGLAVQPGTFNATIDFGTLTVGDRTYIRFTSTGNPGVRRTSLTNGLRDGQLLILQSASNGANGIRILNTDANIAIGTTQDLNNLDVFTLIWDGSRSQWIRVSMQTNAAE